MNGVNLNDKLSYHQTPSHYKCVHAVLEMDARLQLSDLS